MEFHYKAINKAGAVMSGFRKAPNEMALNKDLEAEGLNLISADPTSRFSARALWVRFSTIGGVGEHEKIIMYRNLAAMIDAGLALSRALTVMHKQAKNRQLKKILAAVNDDVKKGSAFSDALAKFPRIFTELMVAMVRAGEESGNLVDALRVTADQMDKAYALKKKIRGAMIYPSVIIGAMIIIGIFMMIYVVPTLTSTFAELGVELPASTRAIISTSDFFQNNLTLVVAVLLAIIIAIFVLMRSRSGRRGLHFVLLRLPLTADLTREINSARTTRTLASLLTAGVPFVRALQITREVIQNSFYKEIIAKAEKNIQIGKPISGVFTAADKLYPTFVGEMMAVGEETGNSAEMLMEVATFYENEVDQKTKNLSTVIEPVLMIIVGLVVGFFAISMIGPMYSLVETI